jgi:hypothetical protein
MLGVFGTLGPFCAFVDPSLDGLNLIRREGGESFRHAGTQFVAGDTLDQEAGFGVARNDGRSADATFEGVFAIAQAQPAVALGWTMAGETGGFKDGQYFTRKIDLTRLGRWRHGHVPSQPQQ